MGEYLNESDFSNIPDGWTIESILKNRLRKQLKKKETGPKSEHYFNFVIEAIEEEFLQEVIQYKEQFLNALKEEYNIKMNSLDRARNLIRRYEGIIENLKDEIEGLKKLEEQLETEIKEKAGGETTETDPMLAGAKEAYRWIFEKTHSEDRAAKAFNSYLWQGKATEEKTFTEKRDIDAMIKNAKEQIRW